METSDLLFVYGTLMSGHDGPEARFLRQKARLIGNGNCEGSLYLINYYPGLRQEGSNGIVWGELFKMKDVSEVFPVLDAYEGLTDPLELKGEEYHRIIIDVHINQQTVRAWTYLYIGVEEGALIESGYFMTEIR